MWHIHGEIIMKKIRFAALILAALMLTISLASCGGGIGEDEVTTTASADDGYAHHMNINVMVYTMVDMQTKKALEEKGAVIGGMPYSVGYNEGDKVNPNTVLEKLAAARKATAVFSSTTGGIVSIKYDGTTYESTRILSDRTGTQENSQGDKYPVRYYDVVTWVWTVNGAVVETALKDVELKDGDEIVLTLTLDNTSEVGYEPIVETDEGEGTTVAP